MLLLCLIKKTCFSRILKGSWPAMSSFVSLTTGPKAVCSISPSHVVSLTRDIILIGKPILSIALAVNTGN